LLVLVGRISVAAVFYRYADQWRELGMRALKILIQRMSGRSIRDTFDLIRSNLYLNYPIRVYRQEIRDGVECLSRSVGDVVIEKGDVELLSLAAETLTPLPWEFQCHTFDGVTDFFVAKNEEGIQHISWIYYDCDHNRLLSLQPTEAEIKFCLTMPFLRGQGIYPTVVKSIIQYLGGNGFKNVYMCVHPENSASIRGIEKAGFHYVGNIKLKKVFGLQVSKRFDTTKVLAQ
jgi:RimJ/RimL family protein N-acetyltransferase